MSAPSLDDRFLATQLADVGPGEITWHAPSPVERVAEDPRDLVDAALDAPLGAPPLTELGRDASRVVIIVSDASRDEPRDAFVDALVARLPRAHITLVVASGTHAPAPPDFLAERHRALPVIVHDGAALDRCEDLGVTAEGTRVRLLREVAEADLVIGTGRIRPHYFAGWSGGAKAIFPGCAFKEDALQNHLLKADPSARLGRVDDNRCRLDMEAAARRVRGRALALNVLCDVDGTYVAAAFGDVVAAHRALAQRAGPLFVVRAPSSPIVVVSDRAPVSSSLYQASKCLPPAGALLEPGGTLVLVADCAQGLGPRERVNEGIYRLGIAAQLPADHRVVLVSTQPEAAVRTSYAEPAPSLRAALDQAFARHRRRSAVGLYRAGECWAEAAPSN